MAPVAETRNTKSLPDRIHRELRKGETIYHSTLPCHVSNKYPEGKWIAQVRRDDARGKLVKYPVKGFGTPREALDYIVSLRPNAQGKVYAARQGEPTVAALYEFVMTHRQKKVSEATKKGKASRWRLYIEPDWADCPISQVTRRAAQEWITEVEAKIANGEAGTLGIPQFEKVRNDLHSMFECVGDFSHDYEDRKNPFAGLDFTPRTPRVQVTIESQHFSAILYACEFFIEEELCTRWIAEQFLTGLFSGMREGEIFALCVDQVDFDRGAIFVDRALRRDHRAIDPKTRLEFGPVLDQAMNYPKKGSATINKTRVIPMSDQLAAILREAIENRQVKPTGGWDLIWPNRNGEFREYTRFRTAWATLTKRLGEVATFAPLAGAAGLWPEVPKQRGWKRNSMINIARKNSKLRLPDIFTDIDFRDTRNSFSSYMNEIGVPQATREKIMGHAGGLTNTVYTEVTSGAFQDARKRLTEGWER